MTEKIDNLFRENLDNYSSHVPGYIWDSIVDKMGQRRRRRLYLLIFAFILLLTTAFILLFPMLDNEASPEFQDNDVFAAEELKRSEDQAEIQQNTHLLNRASVSEEQNNTRNQSSVTIGARNQRSAFALSSQPLPSRNFPGKFSLGSSNLPATFQARQSKVARLADYPSFRCMLYPQAVDQKSFLLANKSIPKFKSKTLGDCFEGPPDRFILGFSAALDYPFRTIPEVAGYELGNYISERNATESEFLSFNAGLQAGYFHPSGLLIRSGLQYTQINEKFLYVKENVIKIQTQITIDTILNSDGSYTITRDTSIVEVMGKEELKTTNHFRMLDIPLVLGYSFDFRNLSLELNAGVIFNLVSRTGGRILNQDMVPSYYGSKDPQFVPYKTYYGMSLYGSVTLLSNFYGHTQFFMEPNFRYYFKSFTRAEYPLRQNYMVVGLSTGMRYYF